MRALLLLTLLLPGALFAAEVTLSWKAPTHNTDGTQLTDLAGYKVYYGLATGDYTTMIDVADPGLTSFSVTNLEGGVTYFFVMTAYNEAGTESDFTSEVAEATEPEPTTPMPPESLTVTEQNLTAYAILESENTVTMLPVGEVAPETACDGTQPVMGMYVVPRDAVAWFGSVKPQVVVAQCDG